ncbi:MAG: type IV toxin-antitoxin system AbiEi family antitoxin [Thermodesulfobacteriota bacterium]|nr:type IV toxin-antitoxin system AbiEi family antitoxin [Thermodesulfobacteriota bacterium]
MKYLDKKLFSLYCIISANAEIGRKMKLGEKELEVRAEEALRACLSKVPFLRIEEIKRKPSGDEVRPDFLFRLTLPQGEQQDLVVDVKSNGQPRLAREAVNQLVRYGDSYPGAYGVLIAPYIAPKAAEICIQEEIGYADLSGNCRLCFGQVYIEQEGKPNAFAEKRDLRSLYSPKAERVLRVLLNHRKRPWKIAELADEAQVSLGQVSNVKKLLNDREWIQVQRGGFILGEPEGLLKEWAENYAFKRNVAREYYSLKGVPEIEADLAEACRQRGLVCALTSFSGAARLAPAVRYQTVVAYIEEVVQDVAPHLGLKEVASGPNVRLLHPYDRGVLYGTRKVEGIQIASPVQIYLDLLSFRGRGEEAAQALLEQVIRKRW